MKISVVIPVFNAEKYVEDAVVSALEQPETAEVILVEDGSRDRSLEVCERLARDAHQVTLLRHPSGTNRGAGAARNLGILNASYDFVAFLDADDYYLPDRFSYAADIFGQDQRVDGVYEATGTHFENEEVKEQWLSVSNRTLTTLQQRVAPEDLFETLGDSGNWAFSPGWTGGQARSLRQDRPV